MAITAQAVKELRELSGAGMMDCKKALTETNGDMDAAFEYLRKSGIAKAEKKAARIAAEGICRVAKEGDNKAVVVEVNSETDFVAKNELFQNYVQEVANQALVTKACDAEGMLEDAWLADTTKTVKDVLVEKTSTIGEKLSIRRFAKVEGDCVTSYIHGGGKIGVLVVGNGAGTDDSVKECLANIAMQVAAMKPKYISKNDISADELAKIREITIDSSVNEPFTLPKPLLQKLFNRAVGEKKWNDADIAAYEENKNNKFLVNFLSDEAKATLIALANEEKESIVADKIFAGLVDGRVSKQLKEIVLLDQAYVKAEDGKQTVENYVASVSKSLKIANFVRFEVGEGMEKKSENFAEEVAKQMGM
ncbi:MAG: translation elongation factor Ts [Lachnospiraceae bacterium]|nr:translation elongation factor Ts [Lachnospiraceae bacterium]